MSKVFVYVEGLAGIPGLPHEISEDDARAKGLDELLKAAIERGAYIEKKSKPERKQKATPAKDKEL